MSPALNGSTALQCFERSNTVEIRNEKMLDFYPGTATCRYKIKTAAPDIHTHKLETSMGTLVSKCYWIVMVGMIYWFPTASLLLFFLFETQNTRQRLIGRQVILGLRTQQKQSLNSMYIVSGWILCAQSYSFTEHPLPTQLLVFPGITQQGNPQ